jgi:hypothetical protein
VLQCVKVKHGEVRVDVLFLYVYVLYIPIVLSRPRKCGTELPLSFFFSGAPKPFFRRPILAAKQR